MSNIPPYPEYVQNPPPQQTYQTQPTYSTNPPPRNYSSSPPLSHPHSIYQQQPQQHAGYELQPQQQQQQHAGYELQPQQQQQHVYPDSPASYPASVATPSSAPQVKEQPYAQTAPNPIIQQYSTPEVVSSPPPAQPPPVSQQTEGGGAALAPPAAQHWTPHTGSPQTWNSTMMSCFDDWKICCMGTWIPCMLYSRTYHRIRTNPSGLGDDFSHCNRSCWFTCFCGSGSCSRQRNEIRYRYNLQGSTCGDFCRHFCCSPCALCQEEREVTYREKTRQNIIQAQQATGYQPNAQMQYQK